MPQQLASSPQLTNATANRGECRVYERYTCELPGFCHPASAGHSPEQKWSATVRDISQGGVNLVLSRRYERGAGLAIELTNGEGEGPRTFFAKVVYTKLIAGGLWSHGCQFTSPLGEDELQQLRQSTATRNECAQVRIQLVDEQGEVVRSLSTKLRISSSWPLAAGKELTLRTSESSSESRSLRIRVIRCEQVGKHWTLQGQLILSAT